ncbi:MAG: response regulator [Armatimonadota bacterium]
MLVVDDEDMVRSALVDLLAASGYRVLEANGGESAMRVCREHAHEIGMIIADVSMPEISGPEFVMQAREVCPEAEVLYMSGHTDETAKRYGLDESDFNYLKKPFDPKQLLSIVRAAVKSRGG